MLDVRNALKQSYLQQICQSLVSAHKKKYLEILKRNNLINIMAH